MRLHTLFILTFLVGCGMKETINSGCGGDLDNFCQMVIGKENDDSQLQEQIDENKELIAHLTELYGLVYNQLLTLEGDIVDNQQTVLNGILVDIVELQNRNTVLELVDPCGDNPNQYDEILVRLSDNTLIAYFESGGKRFLTSLTPGNYRTTDKQKCDFTVTNNMEVL